MVRLLRSWVCYCQCKYPVSIPQWCDCCEALKVDLNELSQFQSHNGAIAALSLKETWRLVDSFNPTMVRLLHVGKHLKRLIILVSIPQWCDCCDFGLHLPRRQPAFQSHNGAIAAGTTVHLQLMTSWFQSHNGAIAALNYVRTS